MDPAVATVFGVPLLEWISQYGYYILVPLLVIEGTTTGFAAGVLASLGAFNPLLIIVVYTFSKIIADTFVYVVARYATDFLCRFRFARSVIERVTQNKEGVERDTIRLFRKHFVISMFLAKVLPGPTLDTALLIGAGAAKLPPRRVYAGIILGQPIWSSMIVGLGYFFGSTVQDLDYLLSVFGFIFIALIAFIILYYRFLHARLMRLLSIDKLFGKE